jgi:hypothetical protein
VVSLPSPREEGLEVLANGLGQKGEERLIPPDSGGADDGSERKQRLVPEAMG